jgi:hypothetical protein
MAINLVSPVMDFLTPDMIGRISSALGLDRSAAQSAINSTVPSLLAGFSNVAAQPGGAQKLAGRRCATGRRSRRLFPHAWDGRPILAH